MPGDSTAGKESLTVLMTNLWEGMIKVPKGAVPAVNETNMAGGVLLLP